ncbi:MAG: hypothetical protein A2Z37_02295 [Chloroflexi bacterium RBG_19FT_COMBO_62_14]|nr:MAG: hypothetical protein A2Z37_02295 [Chloroflexi bacterium RBG_19FT_COMBO_62_14]
MPSRLSNFIVKSTLTSALHPILGEGFAVITVAGGRSGRQYSTPINLIPHGVRGHRPQFTLGERYFLRGIPIFRVLLGRRRLDRLQDQRPKLMTLPHPFRRPWRRNMNMPKRLVTGVEDGSTLSTKRWR